MSQEVRRASGFSCGRVDGESILGYLRHASGCIMSAVFHKFYVFSSGKEYTSYGLPPACTVHTGTTAPTRLHNQ